jgi:dihydropteroate synthase
MNMTSYFRPIVRTGSPRSKDSIFLAETNYWVSEAEEIKFGKKTKLVSINDVPDWWKKRWLKKRADILGMEFGFPKLMGILNVTPDSFSDGGNYVELDAALNQAKFMEENGVDIIDIGGESTRPGALAVPILEEIKRIEPVINGISSRSKIPISVDTRKSDVASAARKAGASMVNDVSGFTFDTNLLSFCSKYKLPVCVMHMQGSPKNMQNNPKYKNILIDVFDFLENQIGVLVQAGISRDHIIADVGIGFGKNKGHNLTLIKNISLFHGLGVPLLLGVSRKSIVSNVAKVEKMSDRVHGSISLAISALGQGVQLFRVHDVAETKQAFDLWVAVNFGE